MKQFYNGLHNLCYYHKTCIMHVFLVHLSRRLKCTIVIMRRLTSVRPSARRPSVVVNFSHFRILLWNRLTEFNETWQEARSQHPLPSLCFRADRKNKMATMASDWLRHFRLLLWNRLTEFNETWEEARSQRPLPSLCFSDRSEKQDGRPGLWLAETFSTSPLKPLNRIQWNLTGSKIWTSSTKFVFFGPIGKNIWPPWPLIGWDIFDFFSETAERNSTKLDREQDLNFLYQVLFFGPIGKTRWLPRPGQSVKKVAHCTQVHDMWPFGPLVYVLNCIYAKNKVPWCIYQNIW